MPKLLSFILKEFFLFFVYIIIALIVVMVLWFLITAVLPKERLYNHLLDTFVSKAFLLTSLFFICLLSIYFYRFLTGAIKQVLK